MRHKRIVSAMTKAGATVVTLHNSRFLARKNDIAVEWNINGGTNYMQNGDGEVCYIVERSPETKAEFDEFHDAFYNTIKSAVNALNRSSR